MIKLEWQRAERRSEWTASGDDWVYLVSRGDGGWLLEEWHKADANRMMTARRKAVSWHQRPERARAEAGRRETVARFLGRE